MIAVAGGHDIRCAPYVTFGTQELSDRVVQAIVGRFACLMAQYGQVVVGPNLDKALALAVEVETLARIYLQACTIGEPPLLSGEQMEQVRHQFRTLDYGN